MERKAEGECLQFLRCRLNVREFEEDGRVRDMLVIEHEADAPDSGREADVLGTGQVVQDNLRLSLGGHVELQIEVSVGRDGAGDGREWGGTLGNNLEDEITFSCLWTITEADGTPHFSSA